MFTFLRQAGGKGWIRWQRGARGSRQASGGAAGRRAAAGGCQAGWFAGGQAGPAQGLGHGPETIASYTHDNGKDSYQNVIGSYPRNKS